MQEEHKYFTILLGWTWKLDSVCNRTRRLWCNWLSNRTFKIVMIVIKNQLFSWSLYSELLKSFIKCCVSSWILIYNINYFLVWTVFQREVRDLYLMRGIGAKDLMPLKESNSIYSLNLSSLSCSSYFFCFSLSFSCFVVSIYDILSL